MLTLEHIASRFELLDQLPKIPANEVTWLWHSDYWDGRIDGLLTFSGKKYWFMRCAEALSFDVGDDEEIDDVWYARFLIVELSAEQLATEERWHALFRKHVGYHTDYVHDGQRDVGQVHPKEGHHKFYEPYQNREPLDLGQQEVIGWIVD